MNKLTNNAKKLDKFFKAMQRIIIIAMAVILIITLTLTVANMINPNAVIGENFNTIDLGNITIELSEHLAPSNESIIAYIWAIIAIGLIGAASIYYGLHLIRKILRPMTEGRPFDSSVSYNIRKLGYVALILGLLQNIGTAIETITTLYAFKLTTLTDSSGAIRSIVANFTLDLTFLIIFFLLLLISHVFSYGTELQQLSDETL